ncbi:hypothetical protein [Segatella copri]|uniref:hypothetical protein n=1 Tax=Segatella copri TaxID=165179 RepID=UPI0020CBD533|nr:hypothetical protein [Segatella copri]
MGTVQVMALNPARKGNMGRLNSSQPLYVYDTLIAQPWLKGVIAQIRGEKAIPGVDAGDEKAVKKAKEGLKRQLPIRAIHYYRFRNNHRSSEDADPESFLFQTTIDVDDVEYVDAALEKARELNCSNTIWKGKLLHLEYSARKKLHIDIRMPMGMTIEETQKAYCEAAGIPYDKSCITPERIIFITDKDSEIYRSKEWYGVLPDEEIKARREAFLKRGLTIDGKGTARYSLLAGDCKSPERLAGDFMGQMAGNANHTVQSSNLNAQGEEEEYPAPPPMPKKLPKLVELLISKTPEIYQPAVAHAIFPSLATHLWRTRFRYIDNVEHEATLMTCLLAGTGAGKSCVQKPIDFIMEDIRKRDAENLKREKEWKDEMMRKGANKDKRKRPENLIIQEIDADMTNPAFVMRTAEAKEHFLYTSLNEIDQFDALKGSGYQQFRIMCLAFGPGNLYGQTRVGTQSVTERVTIRFNWNASTTIHKGIKYFKRVLTDGPVSRINFCTIPERDIGEDIPVYGTYDEEFRNSLKSYIDNLCMASGLVECKEAFHLAEVLKDENAEFSRLSQDRVYENLSFRANVIGYLKACVLYVANGYQWEPEIEDFIRWSERYDLYCKMRFFGDAIKKAERDGDQESKKGPASILAFLPDKFSYQQVESLRLKNDMNAKGTAKMLRNWLHRGYIEKEESDSMTQKLSDSVYFKTHY